MTKSRIYLLFVGLLTFSSFVNAACLRNMTETAPLIFLIDCSLDRTQCTTVKRLGAHEEMCYEGVGFASLKRSKNRRCNKMRMQTNDTLITIYEKHDGKIGCRSRKGDGPKELLDKLTNSNREVKRPLSIDVYDPLKDGEKRIAFHYIHPNHSYSDWEIMLYDGKKKINSLPIKSKGEKLGLVYLKVKEGKSLGFKIKHQTGHIDVDLPRSVGDDANVYVVFDNATVFTSEEEALAAFAALYKR